MPKKATKTTTVEADGVKVGVEETSSAYQEPEGPGVPMDKIKQHYSKPKEFCWGCVNSFKRQSTPGKYPILDKLWNTYQAHRLDTTIERLAYILEKVFNELVYEPSLKAGKPCLPWPAHMIIVHLTPSSAHMQDEQTDLSYKWRTLTVIAAKMENCLFVSTEDGERPHLKSMEMFLKINAETLKVWNAMHAKQ